MIGNTFTNTIKFLGSRTFKNSAQPLIKKGAYKQKNTNFIGNNNRFALYNLCFFVYFYKYKYYDSKAFRYNSMSIVMPLTIDRFLSVVVPFQHRLIMTR